MASSNYVAFIAAGVFLALFGGEVSAATTAESQTRFGAKHDCDRLKLR